MRGTSEAQKIPADYGNQIAEFLRSIKMKREKHDYTDYNIANMDQTMCLFDMAPSKTNNLMNERSVRICTTGGTKRGFIVALSACASGHKMPALICFKEPTGAIPPRVFVNLRIPQNVKITCTKNGWMSTSTMSHWVNRIWRSSDDVRRLLILDRARIHTAAATKQLFEEFDTDVIFVPGMYFLVCRFLTASNPFVQKSVKYFSFGFAFDPQKV